MNENNIKIETAEEATAPIEETATEVNTATEETTTETAATEDIVETFMKMLADNTASINALTEATAKKAKKRNIFAKIGIGLGGFALGTAAGVAAIKGGLI